MIKFGAIEVSAEVEAMMREVIRHHSGADPVVIANILLGKPRGTRG